MPTILIITKNYAPAICGVGDHSERMAGELERKGWRVLIFTATANAVDAKRPVIITEAGFGKGMLRQLQALVAAEKIDAILWQYVPYSYHRKGLPFWWPGLMRRLQKSGCRQFIFFHEVSLRIWGYGFPQGMAAIGQRLIANMASLSAQNSFTSIRLYAGYFLFKKPAIVPISANIVRGGSSVVSRQSSVESGERESSIVIPIPIVPIAIGTIGSEWSIRDDQGPVKHHPDHYRESTAVCSECLVFCFANRADQALLDAVKSVGRQHRLQLVLGGMIGAEKKAVLHQWIAALDLAEIISFTGSLPAAALADMIVTSAVFIQPQIVDRKNQGGVSAKNGTIMAAMCMGKAIITCAGDMTDSALFRDGENMLLVPYGDAAAYEKALLALLCNPDLASRLGTAAAETYRMHCSWEVTGKMINTIIAGSPAVFHPLPPPAGEIPKSVSASKNVTE